MVTFISTLFLSATLVAAAPSASTTEACDAISNALPDGRVSSPLTLSYTSETNSYWATNLHDAKPACLVLPESADEMSLVVKTLNKYPSVEFAIKSGGHTPNKRHSSIQDGVLISTKNLAGTTYDPETELAHVEPGGEWNDVFEELGKHGVAIVGGRLGLVGVGGYLLQGGISFLSAQYGLAADSIVGWELVTADGSIRYVNATEEPETAIALRGSGSQFGIVTKFVVKAYPMGEVWGGFRLYDSDKADELYAALHKFVPENNDEEESAIIFTDIVATGGLQTFLIFYFHQNPEPPTTGPLARFLEIDSIVSTTKARDYGDLLKTNGEGAELLHSRISFRTYMLPYVEENGDIYKEIKGKFNSLVGDYLKSPLRITSQCSIDFQPFPSAIGKHTAELGGNAMGLSDDDGDRMLLEIQCSWASADDDELFLEASQELTDWLSTKVPEWTNGGEETYLPFLMNDAAFDQNVTGSYRDYESLKALQAKMDPRGFFEERGGGFTF